MIRINNILELNNLKVDNYLFEVMEDSLKIINRKEKFEINLAYNKENVISTLETIKKLTEIKIVLDSFKDREILSYIESKGFNKLLWNPIGKAMHRFNMIEAGDRVAVGISGGKDSIVLILSYIESKGFNKLLWNPIGKAMHRFNMIEAGDRVAVGISGGKDSIVLFNALVRIKKIANLDFEIIPIHIHMKEDLSDLSELTAYIKKFGYDLKVIETNLGNLVKEKNPCFLCGRLRRGILYTFMKENSINKLALGHHKDDIIETFLLNIIYQGNHLSR